jgi:hypothetical protein
MTATGRVLVAKNHCFAAAQPASGGSERLAEALGWAVDPDGSPATDDDAHVINFSLGGTQETPLLKRSSGW